MHTSMILGDLEKAFHILEHEIILEKMKYIEKFSFAQEFFF